MIVELLLMMLSSAPGRNEPVAPRLSGCSSRLEGGTRYAGDSMSEAAGQAARAQWPVLAGAVALALGRERLRSAFS
jgi:hypothetical protein